MLVWNQILNYVFKTLWNILVLVFLHDTLIRRPRALHYNVKYEYIYIVIVTIILAHVRAHMSVQAGSILMRVHPIFNHIRYTTHNILFSFIWLIFYSIQHQKPNSLLQIYCQAGSCNLNEFAFFLFFRTNATPPSVRK